jgi:hypothetical protein
MAVFHHSHVAALGASPIAKIACILLILAAVIPNVTESEIVGLVTAVLVSWNTWRASRNEKVVRSIHTLTNSAMGAQLKLNVQFAEKIAVGAHRLADVTKEAGDAAAAIAAEVVVEAQKSIYQDHLLRQAKVDAVNPQ